MKKPSDVSDKGIMKGLINSKTNPRELILREAWSVLLGAKISTIFFKKNYFFLIPLPYQNFDSYEIG